MGEKQGSDLLKVVENTSNNLPRSIHHDIQGRICPCCLPDVSSHMFNLCIKRSSKR